MAKTAILVQNTGSTQIFAHPDDITYTVTVKRRLSDKSIDGRRFPNVRTELILNRQAEIQLCDETCGGSETLSVRLAISGTPRNEEKLNVLLTELKSHIDQMMTDKVVKGFPVTTLSFND